MRKKPCVPIRESSPTAVSCVLDAIALFFFRIGWARCEGGGSRFPMAAELVGPRVYSCCNCRNHVCLHDDVISKAFQGRNGRAFLFSHAMNVVVGAKEDRQLMTGLHTVADIYCKDCRDVLGWKYERAYEETQKYKEGKFIFEKSKIVKENW